MRNRMFWISEGAAQARVASSFFVFLKSIGFPNAEIIGIINLCRDREASDLCGREVSERWCKNG